MKLYFEDWPKNRAEKNLRDVRHFLWSAWCDCQEDYVDKYKKSNELSLSDYVWKNKDRLVKKVLERIDNAHITTPNTGGRPQLVGHVKVGREWTDDEKDAAREYLNSLTQADYNRILYLKRDEQYIVKEAYIGDSDNDDEFESYLEQNDVEFSPGVDGQYIFNSPADARDALELAKDLGYIDSWRETNIVYLGRNW